MKKQIVFICNGNIHRSVVAEKCLIKTLKENKLNSEFSVASYGLQGTKGTDKPLHENLKEYPREYKAALPTLHKFKIDVTDHLFQKITPTVMKRATVVIAMDKKSYSSAKNSLLAQFPEFRNKIHIFYELTKNHKDIKDPAGSDDVRIHGAVIKNIFSTIKKQLTTLLSWADSDG